MLKLMAAIYLLNYFHFNFDQLKTKQKKEIFTDICHFFKGVSHFAGVAREAN